MSYDTQNFPERVNRGATPSATTAQFQLDGSNNLKVAVQGTVTTVGGGTLEASGGGTNTSVNVSTSAVQLVAANTDRASLIIENAGTNTIYFGHSGVTTSTGISVAAGGKFTWGPGEDHTAIYAIAATGTNAVRVREVSYA